MDDEDMADEQGSLPWHEAGKLLRSFTVEVYENGIHVDTHDTCDYMVAMNDMVTVISRFDHPDAQVYDSNLKRVQ